MRRLWMIPLVCALAACATTPAPQDAESPVPAANMLAFAQRVDGDASIVVKRDTGFMGRGCGIVVSVDGTDAAIMGAGERASLYVPAGDHILGARSSSAGLCAIGSNGNARTLRVVGDLVHGPSVARAYGQCLDISCQHPDNPCAWTS